jgi:putative flippase GtrA
MSFATLNELQRQAASDEAGLCAPPGPCMEEPLFEGRVSEFWVWMNNSQVSRELGRYFLAGCLAFACDASTLYILTRFLGVYYLKSAIAGFGFGLVVSYLTSRFWVFERRTLTNTTAESAIFSGIAISGLGLNEAVLWIFQAKLGIGYLVAKFVSGGALFAWNFTVRKVALFR